MLNHGATIDDSAEMTQSLQIVGTSGKFSPPQGSRKMRPSRRRGPRVIEVCYCLPTGEISR
jgi:hypothetical protein